MRVRLMFGKKKDAIPEVAFDPQKQKAILKCSICTGEQVAGFKDLSTGKFSEVCVVRSQGELAQFLQKYHLSASDITKEY